MVPSRRQEGILNFKRFAGLGILQGHQTIRNSATF